VRNRENIGHFDRYKGCYPKVPEDHGHISLLYYNHIWINFFVILGEYVEKVQDFHHYLCLFEHPISVYIFPFLFDQLTHGRSDSIYSEEFRQIFQENMFRPIHCIR
jgi:hypothetical protein